MLRLMRCRVRLRRFGSCGLREQFNDLGFLRREMVGAASRGRTSRNGSITLRATSGEQSHEARTGNFLVGKLKVNTQTIDPLNQEEKMGARMTNS